MAIEKGKNPVPLVITTEETAAPMTVAGPHAIAFALARMSDNRAHLPYAGNLCLMITVTSGSFDM